MVYTLGFFFCSKYSLFRNSNIFGSCIIHILYTVCAKIKKKIIPTPKGWCPSVRPSVCQSSCVSAAPIGRISVKVYVGNFYENLSRKCRFGWNQTKMSADTLHEYISTFYCRRRYEFIIETLLWNNVISLYCHWLVDQRYIKNALLRFHCHIGYATRNNIALYVGLRCLSLMYLFIVCLCFQ